MLDVAINAPPVFELHCISCIKKVNNQVDILIWYSFRRCKALSLEVLLWPRQLYRSCVRALFLLRQCLIPVIGISVILRCDIIADVAFKEFLFLFMKHRSGVRDEDRKRQVTTLDCADEFSGCLDACQRHGHCYRERAG